jgi:hypothetical protein
MKQEFLRSRTFRVSYEDNSTPFVNFKDDNRPVLVKVTDCFSGDVVSTFKVSPKNLYKELYDRGYSLLNNE